MSEWPLVKPPGHLTCSLECWRQYLGPLTHIMFFVVVVVVFFHARSITVKYCSITVLYTNGARVSVK